MKKKTRDVVEDYADEKQALQNDPIEVVAGPGLEDYVEDLYVVDHHHGALAFLNAGYTLGFCKSHPHPGIIPRDNASGFWAGVVKENLARMRDQNGETLTADHMPTTVGSLPDDPYRTLSWMVRKADGYCRALMLPSPPPFAEFKWADEMRGKLTWLDGEQRVKVPQADVVAATAPALWEPLPGEKKKDTRERREAAQQRVLTAGLAFAMSDEAKDSTGARLPGWNGQSKQTGQNCNPKDD